MIRNIVYINITQILFFKEKIHKFYLIILIRNYLLFQRGEKMEEYENLLNRAIDQLPPEVFETKRFEPVKAYSVIQGNRTFIQNFKDVADSLNRDPQHVLKYLLRELGTAGNLEGVRAILQGKFNHFLINERIDEYIEKYVICHECNRPDTKIIREDRIFILKCAACGAKAPLKPL